MYIAEYLGVGTVDRGETIEPAIAGLRSSFSTFVAPAIAAIVAFEDAGAIALQWTEQTREEAQRSHECQRTVV